MCHPSVCSLGLRKTTVHILGTVNMSRTKVAKLPKKALLVKPHADFEFSFWFSFNVQLTGEWCSDAVRTLSNVSALSLSTSASQKNIVAFQI